MIIALIIIGLVIYLISFAYCYKWIKESHAFGGKHYNSDLTLMDIYVVIIPVVNTLFMGTSLSTYTDNSKKFIWFGSCNRFCKWFFGLSKK